MIFYFFHILIVTFQPLQADECHREVINPGYNNSKLFQQCTDQNNWEQKEFLKDLIKESGSKDVVLVSHSDVLLDQEHTSFGMVSFDITTATKKDFDNYKTTRVKSNTQPLYLVVSEDLLTLEKGLGMIRAADHRNPIVAFTTNFEELSSDIYNSYFVTRGKGNVLMMSEICMFCQKGNDEVKQVNSWGYEQGFSQPFKLPQSFKNQFHGKQLRYGCRNLHFYNDLMKFAMNYLQKSLNFTTLVIPKITGNKILKFMIQGKTDLCGCNTGMTWQRYQSVDFSLIYNIMEVQIVSVKPEKGLVWYSLVQPFTLSIWLLIILTTAISAGSLYVLYAWKRNTIAEKPFNDCLWEILCILLWDSIVLKDRPGNVCLFFGFFMLGTFVLVAEFFGALTSTLTNKPYLWSPIDDIEQFRESSMQYLVREGGFVEETFFAGDTNLRNKMKLIQPGKNPLFEVEANPRDYVFIIGGVEGTIKKLFMYVDGRHNFHISKEAVSYGFHGIFFRKGTLYQESFNVQLARLWENGVMKQRLNNGNYIATKQAMQNAKDQQRFGPPPPSDELKLVHLSAAFAILAIGDFIALMIFTFGAFANWVITFRSWYATPETLSK